MNRPSGPHYVAVFNIDGTTWSGKIDGDGWPTGLMIEAFFAYDVQCLGSAPLWYAIDWIRKGCHEPVIEKAAFNGKLVQWAVRVDL